MIGDEHLLAPVPRQAFGDDPGDDVGRAARAGGDDQLDRRVGEGLRGCWRVDDCGGEQHQGPKQTHVLSYHLIFFAVSAITGRQICCCSRMKAVSSSGVVRRM